MNNITALFTAARHCCLDHPYSISIDEGHEWGYHFGAALKARGARSTYPDSPQKNDEVSNFFGDLMTIIEHAVPEDFSSLDELKTFLLRSSQRAYEQRRRAERASVDEIDWGEVTTARTAFQEYIAAMTPDQLADVKPLTFHHYMSPKERERLWYRLKSKWNVGISSYWYPIAPMDLPPQPAHVVAYQIEWFQQGVPLKTLHAILQRHGIGQVWEFIEHIMPFMKDVVEDVTLMVPRAGIEAYWSSEKRDWIIYTSHESSLTVGGTWLNEAIKRVWPTWEKYVYVDAFYPRPVIGARAKGQ